jgi:hypothetical protein
MSTQVSKISAQSKMKILVLLAVMLWAVGSLLIPSRPAGASHLSEGVWAHAVNACAIDEADLREYRFDPNSMLHRAGVIGTIVARCNVENLPIVPGNQYRLELIYRDPDGMGNQYRVVARLIRIDNAGAVAQLALVNSNIAAGGMAFQSLQAPFATDFNFIENAYYVEVSVFRDNVEQVPAAAIVRIKPD